MFFAISITPFKGHILNLYHITKVGSRSCGVVEWPCIYNTKKFRAIAVVVWRKKKLQRVFYQK